MALIDAQRLTKNFGIVRAVDDISLKVEEGSVSALIGPNGAGKTTTVKIILGLVKPDSGEIRVLGEKPWDNSGLRRRIGIISEQPLFPLRQKTLDYLERVCRIYGFPKVKAKQVLELVNLTDECEKQIRTLSASMLQRFAFAHALIDEPKLIIADEMMMNIDPHSRSVLLDLIQKLRKEEHVTFLLSSNIVPELSKVCDDVFIMSRGKILAAGKLEELGEKFSAETVRIITDQPAKLVELMKTLSYVEHVSIDDGGISMKLTKGKEDNLHEDAQKLAAKNQIQIQDIEDRAISLQLLYREVVTREGEAQK